MLHTLPLPRSYMRVTAAPSTWRAYSSRFFFADFRFIGLASRVGGGFAVPVVFGADLAEPSAAGTASISCKANRRSRRTHILVISTSTAASLADTVGGLVAPWPARGSTFRRL